MTVIDVFLLGNEDNQKNNNQTCRKEKGFPGTFNATVLPRGREDCTEKYYKININLLWAHFSNNFESFKCYKVQIALEEVGEAHETRWEVLQHSCANPEIRLFLYSIIIGRFYLFSLFYY